MTAGSTTADVSTSVVMDRSDRCAPAARDSDFSRTERPVKVGYNGTETNPRLMTEIGCSWNRVE